MSNAAKDVKTSLSEQEIRFLATILAHNTAKLDVDWDVVAAESGYNGAGTARVRWGQVKKKLNGQVGTTAGVASPGRISKSSPDKKTRQPRKKAVATKTPRTPKGGLRKTGPGPSAAKMERDDDDDADADADGSADVEGVKQLELIKSEEGIGGNEQAVSAMEAEEEEEEDDDDDDDENEA